MADVSPPKKIPPGAALEAADGEAYAEAVRACVAEGRAIADYGGCCGGLGYPARQGAVRIRPPAGVIEHHVSDFTVTAAGGTTLADLQQALRPHGQFLPIDGVPPTASIAEMIAHNCFGPLRLGYGAMRELLLGLRIVDGRGRLLRVGGRTVKNVAGYDVTRLMIGSLNTLGLIAEATLRTAARPEHVTVVHVDGVAPWEMDDRISSLLTSDAMPAHLAAHSTLESGGAVRHCVRLGYVGSHTGRDAQYAALQAWLKANLPEFSPRREEVAFDDDEVDRQSLRAWQDEAAAWVKIIVPPAMAGAAVRSVVEHLASAQVAAQIQVLPAWGVVHVGGEWDADTARSLDAHLMREIAAAGAVRAWMRRPPAADDIPPVAPEQPDWPLIRRIRHVFDPHDVLNPGRFI